MLKPIYVWNKEELKLNLGLEDIKDLLKYESGCLFNHEGKFTSLNINKIPLFWGEYNTLIGWGINSDVKLKNINDKNIIPKLQYMYSIQNKFINYFSSLLHSKGIFSSVIDNLNIIEDKKWVGDLPKCGISLSYDRSMFILPENITFLGNIYLLSDGFHIQKETKLLNNELELAGKVMSIAYNLFEKIYNPKFILNDDLFLIENGGDIILNDSEIEEACEIGIVFDSHEMHDQFLKDSELRCINTQWNLYQKGLVEIKRLGKEI